MRTSLGPADHPSASLSDLPYPPLPIILDGIPLMYEEDEEEIDMGEANLHLLAIEILHICLIAHLAARPAHRVFANLNLYYSAAVSTACVSPDVMAVTPFVLPADDLSSYRIGETGPGPLLVAEVLSPSSTAEEDLGRKLGIYAQLGIAEYLVVDVLGIADLGPLTLKRLQRNRTWIDERDPDGGITSQLGFRLIIETDGQLRMIDVATGKRYARPHEAQAEADARRQAEERARSEAEARRVAEERIRVLEAENARLKSKGKGRKRKGS